MQRETHAESAVQPVDTDEAVEAYVQAVSSSTLHRLRQLIPRWEAHFSDVHPDLRAANDSADAA